MKLYRHQKYGTVIGRKKNTALFWDCGTGKTLTMLKIIEHHKDNGNLPVLIVCPLSVIEEVWINECNKYTPSISITSLWSKKPKERIKKLAEDHDVYVINYAAFKNMYKAIIEKEFKVIIIDESSKLKNFKSQITKAVLTLAGIGPVRSKTGFTVQVPIPYRYVLSGTPAPNDESEYWGQIKFITGCGNKCFNDNYYKFRNKYCSQILLPGSQHVMYKFRQSMKSDLLKRMKPYVNVVRKDVLNLPEPLPPQIRKIKLSNKELKAYESLKNDYILEVDGSVEALALTKLTEIMKLRQITSGFCYSDDGVTKKLGTSKLNELKNLLDEIGNNQVIIWYNFIAEANMISSSLKDCIVYDGNSQVIKDFKNGKFKCLLLNVKSAAYGLTFNNCSYNIYYSLDYSYESHEQSKNRIYRIGQKNNVVHYYLIADNTVDELIYRALINKWNKTQLAMEFFKNGK